jgi:hypothetical protein
MGRSARRSERMATPQGKSSSTKVEQGGENGAALCSEASVHSEPNDRRRRAVSGRVGRAADSPWCLPGSRRLSSRTEWLAQAFRVC